MTGQGRASRAGYCNQAWKCEGRKRCMRRYVLLLSWKPDPGALARRLLPSYRPASQCSTSNLAQSFTDNSVQSTRFLPPHSYRNTSPLITILSFKKYTSANLSVLLRPVSPTILRYILSNLRYAWRSWRCCQRDTKPMQSWSRPKRMAATASVDMETWLIEYCVNF
jgi:hypothetical protein